MKRQVAYLPLHGGKAPAWLFQRMVPLAGAITMAVVDQFGPREMLRRLADPWWFQAFGCVLGFDWHSSGLTTVTCGAIKEAARKLGDDLGILVAGGKGAASRKTPQEIAEAADRHGIAEGDRLVHASRMSAKVDSAAVQDGYQLYHHSFFLTPDGAWCVVQQGMNNLNGMARRYHWLGESVRDFVCEPHHAIDDLGADFVSGQERLPFSANPALGESNDLPLLNMVAWEASDNRRASTSIVNDNLDKMLLEIQRLTEGPTLFAPRHHSVLPADINAQRLEHVLRTAHEQCPRDFEALLGLPGVGPATVRSLSLLAELIYAAPASHRDPAAPLPSEAVAAREATTAATDSQATACPPPRKWADYSYAHGGKDGHPFPVDRSTYDRNIAVLTDAVRKARVGQTDKVDALKRLARLASSTVS